MPLPIFIAAIAGIARLAPVLARMGPIVARMRPALERIGSTMSRLSETKSGRVLENISSSVAGGLIANSISSNDEALESSGLIDALNRIEESINAGFAGKDIIGERLNEQLSDLQHQLEEATQAESLLASLGEHQGGELGNKISNEQFAANDATAPNAGVGTTPAMNVRRSVNDRAFEMGADAFLCAA